MHTKVLIIGSGPAGYTAAIYAARAMLKPVMVQGYQPGGQLTITTDVENYPGFGDIVQGPWLMEQMQKQAHNVGTELITDMIKSVDLSSKPYKNLNPVLRIFLLDKENPRFGISSFVSLKVIFGLCFLQISATSLTVRVSLVKLNVSEDKSSLSSINLKHLATSIIGTKLLICLPPAKSFSVPSCEAIFENRFGIILSLVESSEFP